MATPSRAIVEKLESKLGVDLRQKSSAAKSPKEADD